MMEYIWIFISLVLAFSFNIFLYYIITSKKCTINVFGVLSLLFSSFLLTIFNILSQTMLLTFGNLICTCLILYFWYKPQLNKCMFYSVVIWLLTILSEVLISLILINKGMNYDIIQNKYIFRCILTIPVFLVEIVIVFIPGFRKKINEFIDKYTKRITNNTFFTIIAYMMIYMFLILVYLHVYKSSSKTVYYTLTAIMIFILFIVVILIREIIKIYELSIMNENIKTENKLLKEIADKDSIFRHNLINNLIGLEAIANKKSVKVIEQLIESYQCGYKNLNNITKLPSGIDGLIYKKLYLKNNQNLNLIVENTIKEDIFKHLNSKKYNLLMEAIGILIDNALEASEKCKNGIMIIGIYKNKNKLLFEIKNNFSETLDLEKLGTKNYTTKKEGHGIGLNYLIKNRSVKLNTNIINNFFCAELELELKNSNI